MTIVLIALLIASGFASVCYTLPFDLPVPGAGYHARYTLGVEWGALTLDYDEGIRTGPLGDVTLDRWSPYWTVIPNFNPRYLWCPVGEGRVYTKFAIPIWLLAAGSAFATFKRVGALPREQSPA